MPRSRFERSVGHLRTPLNPRTLLFALCLALITGCGSDNGNRTEAQSSDEGRHMLSDQQEALERSKAAAEAMQKSADERAEQYEGPN